jgi:hypothetical protein
MALLKREQVKQVVINSLSIVADLPSDVESVTFEAFNELQVRVFLSTLKRKLNGLPYYLNDGTTSDRAYYDIDIKSNALDDWPTVKHCIDWIEENQRVVYYN